MASEKPLTFQEQLIAWQQQHGPSGWAASFMVSYDDGVIFRMGPPGHLREFVANNNAVIPYVDPGVAVEGE